MAASKSESLFTVFGNPRSPLVRNAIFVLVVLLLVLGLVGGFAETLVGNVGVSKNFTRTPTTLTTSLVPIAGKKTVPQSLNAFMSIKHIAGVTANNFTLIDQHNHPWSLKSYIGKAVVVTFYGVDCRDICSVLGREIKQANSILGARASHLAFAIVNTNPDETGFIADPPALSIPSLSNVHSVHFLNGSLASLNRVWTAYGVTIDARSRLNIYHNNVMFFINPQGKLTELAVPFGDENRRGKFSLKSSDIHRFAQGIALIVGRLVK